MKKSVLSLLTGAALLGSVGVASAAELMVLPNAAMDGITAGDLNQINTSTIAQTISQTQTQSPTLTASTFTGGAQSQSASNTATATQSNAVGNISAGGNATF